MACLRNPEPNVFVVMSLLQISWGGGSYSAMLQKNLLLHSKEACHWLACLLLTTTAFIIL